MSFESKIKYLFLRNTIKSNTVFTQALIAVARAMPISRILPINKRERTMLVITLTIEI